MLYPYTSQWQQIEKELFGLVEVKACLMKCSLVSKPPKFVITYL